MSDPFGWVMRHVVPWILLGLLALAALCVIQVVICAVISRA